MAMIMLYSLFFSIFILIIITLVLIIRSKWNVIVTMLLVPFLLFNIGFGWHTVDSMWGQAKQTIPEDKQLMILWTAVQKPWVYYILQDIELVDGKPQEPKFYKIPWTKDQEKKSRKGQEEMENGQTMMIRKKEKRPGESADSQIELYRFDHQRAMPKNK